MSEEWKAIPGFEGLYDASSLGRIRSTPGKTTSNARYPIRVWRSRIMKTKAQKGLHRHDQRVTLWKDGKAADYLVARLVAMAWIGVPDDYLTVNHINGNYLDNRPENLEWVSLPENIKHGFSSGLYASIEIPVVLVSNKGESFTFQSMSSAAQFLGHGRQYISDRLAKGYATANSANGTVYEILRSDRR